MKAAARPAHENCWTACAECQDIHLENQRVWKKSRWGFSVGLCPKCGGWPQVARAQLNLQRDLPLFTASHNATV